MKVIVVDVFEDDTGQPIDTQMDVFVSLLAIGYIQISASRRTCADKHGIVTLVQKSFLRY